MRKKTIELRKMGNDGSICQFNTISPRLSYFVRLLPDMRRTPSFFDSWNSPLEQPEYLQDLFLKNYFANQSLEFKRSKKKPCFVLGSFLFLFV